METILNTDTTRICTLCILTLAGILAFSGCSQKASTEEKAREHATAQKSAAKPGHVAQADPVNAETSVPVNKTACTDCGVVISVNEIDEEGKGSGLGAVAGGVAGGIIGNQVGQGTGRDLATIAGLVGGAFAGNTVEKKMKKTRVYDVTVKMENGEQRVLRYKTAPGVMAGDKIKVEGEKIVRQ